MVAYRLHFHAPLRIAPLGPPRVSSSTLTAALLSAYRHLHPYADMDKLAAAPPFAVSDALPFRTTRAGTTEYFLPLPLSAAGPVADEQGTAATHLSLELYCRLAEGRPLPEAVHRLDGGRLLSTAPEGAPPLRRSFRGHRRVAGETATRAEAELGFAPGAGLWFAAEFEARDVQRRVEAALRLLGDTGLGAGRATGRGRFFAVPDEAFALPAPSPPAERAGRMLLGAWLPAADELAARPFDAGARWRLEWVGDWQSGERVATVGAGSVLRGAAGVAGSSRSAPRCHGRTLAVAACLA